MAVQKVSWTIVSHKLCPGNNFEVTPVVCYCTLHLDSHNACHAPPTTSFLFFTPLDSVFFCRNAISLSVETHKCYDNWKPWPRETTQLAVLASNTSLPQNSLHKFTKPVMSWPVAVLATQLLHLTHNGSSTTIPSLVTSS